jgi:hypothetical protein
MQLASPHKGWENEHLATFLLSRIAFVAGPVTVADDIGTDIFCTLFEVGKHKGQDVLLPRSSIESQHYTLVTTPRPSHEVPKPFERILE